MCVLCGEFISSFHWSDVDFRAQNVVNVGENATQRKRARLKRASILNEILGFYGLKIADWQGSKFVLSDKKGQSVIVNDLGDLWGKANALCGRDLDALDEKLLAFLQANFLQKNEQNLNENLQNLKQNLCKIQSQNLAHEKGENLQILNENLQNSKQNSQNLNAKFKTTQSVNLQSKSVNFNGEIPQNLKTQNKNSHQKQNKNLRQIQNQNLSHAKSENLQILSKISPQNKPKNNA